MAESREVWQEAAYARSSGQPACILRPSPLADDAGSVSSIFAEYVGTTQRVSALAMRLLSLGMSILGDHVALIRGVVCEE